MRDYTIKLTEEEMKTIMEALFSMPFKDVFELIGKLNEQLVIQEEKTNGQANVNTKSS